MMLREDFRTKDFKTTTIYKMELNKKDFRLIKIQKREPFNNMKLKMFNSNNLQTLNNNYAKLKVAK